MDDLIKTVLYKSPSKPKTKLGKFKEFFEGSGIILAAAMELLIIFVFATMIVSILQINAIVFDMTETATAIEKQQIYLLVAMLFQQFFLMLLFFDWYRRVIRRVLI